MSPVSLALEILLAFLLIACLFYCWRLERKLNALRSGEQGIRAAAAELNRAVAQAETAVKALRIATHESAAGQQRDEAFRRTPERSAPQAAPARAEATRRRAL